MNLFERIQNKRYDLQEKRRANRVSGASNEKPTGSVSRGTYKSSPEGQKKYDATKTDIEAKRLLKKAGASGDVSSTAPKNVRDRVKEIRQKRADKLGTPDPFDPDYDKKTKPVDGRTKVGKVFKSTKPVTTSAPGFGKGDTPGQTRVKGLEKKAFKKTQPSDIKLPKSFTDFQSNLQDYKDKDKATMRTGKSSSKIKITGGENLTRQDVGMAPPDKPKVVKQSEVSKKAKDFTKQINQNRTSSGTPMRKGATNVPKDAAKDIQVKKMRDRVSKLVGERETKRSVTGTKDVKGMRKINKEIRQYQRSIKRNPLVPTVYDPKNKSTAKVTQDLTKKMSEKQLTDKITFKQTQKSIRPQRQFYKGAMKTTQGITKALGGKSAKVAPAVKTGLKIVAKAGPVGAVAAGTGLALLNPSIRKTTKKVAKAALGAAGITAFMAKPKKVNKPPSKIGINLSPKA